MFFGNRMCTPARVSTYSDAQGPANQQMSFSVRDEECVAQKLPFSGHINKKFRGPSILHLNKKGLTASKMNVLHHLATQLEAFVILLQETHCTSIVSSCHSLKESSFSEEASSCPLCASSFLLHSFLAKKGQAFFYSLHT